MLVSSSTNNYGLAKNCTRHFRSLTKFGKTWFLYFFGPACINVAGKTKLKNTVKHSVQSWLKQPAGLTPNTWISLCDALASFTTSIQHCNNIYRSEKTERLNSSPFNKEKPVFLFMLRNHKTFYIYSSYTHVQSCMYSGLCMCDQLSCSVEKKVWIWLNSAMQWSLRLAPGIQNFDAHVIMNTLILNVVLTRATGCCGRKRKWWKGRKPRKQ